MGGGGGGELRGEDRFHRAGVDPEAESPRPHGPVLQSIGPGHYLLLYLLFTIYCCIYYFLVNLLFTIV